MVTLFLRALIRSFNLADEGIVYTIHTQRNMKIHVTLTLLVLLLALLLNIDNNDTLYLLLIIGIILFAELINTAIENTVDLVTSDFAPRAKLAKDTAAGAVLMMSLIAVLIGVMIFLPYLRTIYLSGWSNGNTYLPSFFVLQGLFVIMVTYILKAYWYSKKIEYQPSVFLSLIFFLISVISLYYLWVRYFIVILFFVLLILLIKKSYKQFLLIIQTAIVSIGLTYLLFWLFY